LLKLKNKPEFALQFPGTTLLLVCFGNVP